MTNSKSTKRALFTSALAMLMCVAMLIGTTFAWFTDTASTAVNKIQSGKLDVALEMNTGTTDEPNWVSAEGKTLQFKVNGQIPEEGTQILWEPGCTYELPELRVVNNGNLALKYKILITGIQGDAKLNEAIEWTIEEVALGTEQHLTAGANNEFTIKGHMKEDAGNEYQNLSIDGISITVVATQDTVEYDSNDNQYDKDAAITVIGGNEAIATTGDNANIVVADTAVIDSSTSIGKGTTISGTGVDSTTVEVEKAKVAKDDVTIKDMTINGSGSSGNEGTLGINGNNTTVENVNYVGDGNIAVTVSTGTNNSGTTFKGVKITNAFRGIQFWSLSGNSLIEDCEIDVAGYTFNVDAVVAGATLTIKNSTLNGWTSYTSGISKVSFEGCKLGLNTYEYLRPYSTTELTNCEFTSENYKLNAGGRDNNKASTEWPTYTITLTNCTKNGTAITAENVKALLLDTGNWNSNVTLIVNGVTVTVS